MVGRQADEGGQGIGDEGGDVFGEWEAAVGLGRRRSSRRGNRRRRRRRSLSDVGRMRWLAGKSGWIVLELLEGFGGVKEEAESGEVNVGDVAWFLRTDFGYALDAADEWFRAGNGTARRARPSG